MFREVRLGLYVTRVKQFPYRTAVVPTDSRFIEIPREQMESFEKELADKAHSRTDNHTCYEIEIRDGSILYVSCSDSTFAIGNRIVVKNW